MGIDVTKRCVFPRQRDQCADKHNVLDDVGEIAGMEPVTIVQRSAQGSHGQLRRTTRVGKDFRRANRVGAKIFGDAYPDVG